LRTSGKKTQPFADELRGLIIKQRQTQKQQFTTEASTTFGEAVTDMSEQTVKSLGVRHTQPDFIFSSKFSLRGIIKKAGENFIIEIGKLEGERLDISADQRKRKLDIYFPYPQTTNFEVSLAIPAGFTAEGVEALTKKLENQAGSFVSEAKISGQSVILKVTKTFNHGLEPAANWENLLAIIDAANESLNAKILIKKK
jgi:hypothetical protein